jgi:hypothetical protein
MSLEAVVPVEHDGLLRELPTWSSDTETKPADRTPEELRMWCLERAMEGDKVGRAAETIVSRAAQFESYIRNTNG